MKQIVRGNNEEGNIGKKEETGVQGRMKMEGTTQAQTENTCILLALLSSNRHYMGVGGKRQVPVPLSPEISPSTHCRGDWVGPRAGLEKHGVKKTSCVHRGSILDLPARSQLLLLPTVLSGPLWKVEVRRKIECANWYSEVCVLHSDCSRCCGT
jgi:hypothetical protein